MHRLNINEYFLRIADLVAQRSTCRRRKVGCVLIDTNNYIRATGYNGVPRRFVHCLDSPCPGAYAPSGQDLSECLAVHAEINAFLQLTGEKNNINTAYLTVSPCRECAKIFANSWIHRIITREIYSDAIALDILTRANIILEVL